MSYSHDAQEDRPVAQCDRCCRDIYAYEVFGWIGRELVCDQCIDDYFSALPAPKKFEIIGAEPIIPIQ